MRARSPEFVLRGLRLLPLKQKPRTFMTGPRYVFFAIFRRRRLLPAPDLHFRAQRRVLRRSTDVNLVSAWE